MSVEVMRRFPEAGVPTLGVCLGHQSLVQAFGGTVVRHVPVHGKATEIEHDGDGPVRRAAEPADRRPLPLAGRRPRPARTASRSTARGGGVLMAMRHRELPALRRPVPPRVGAHAGRQAPAGELPRATPILTEAIDALASRRDLSADQAAAVLAEIMEGNASEVQTAAVLIALRTKGETVDEIVGLATTMRRARQAGARPSRDDLIDTAGTGGGRPTFNVSTTAALIAAGAGCAVAKHGNRSATGLSGSADLLEALGVRIDLEPEAVARCIERGRLRVHVRARAPRRHALRRPGAQGARRADDLQLPRPAHQPGRRDAAGHRRVRPGVPGHDRRSAGAAGRRRRRW